MTTVEDTIGCMCVWKEVRDERVRAHAKHGDTSMESQWVGNLRRLAILMEEVGEVAKEFNDGHHRGAIDFKALRKELIQTAAMAGAWADAISQYHDCSGG